MTKEVYVYITEVPEDKKEYIIPNKRYKVENCMYNQKGKYYTGDIDHELGYSWFIITDKCAHLHYTDWEVEISDVENPNEVEARKVLARKVLASTWESLAKYGRTEMYLNGSFTKEELEAIITLWDEIQ